MIHFVASKFAQILRHIITEVSNNMKKIQTLSMDHKIK
jgi:hypothetical protein